MVEMPLRISYCCFIKLVKMDLKSNLKKLHIHLYLIATQYL